MINAVRNRMFELRPVPGSRPVLKNPKPSSPVRHLELTAFGWALGPEQYGPEQPVRCFEVSDPEAAIRQLEDFARSKKDTPLVYYVARGRKTSIGAVALGSRVPLGWEPISVSRPYPE